MSKIGQNIREKRQTSQVQFTRTLHNTYLKSDKKIKAKISKTRLSSENQGSNQFSKVHWMIYI